MGGLLRIHSTIAGDTIFGHSWIEYCPIDGDPKTYGTWGNNPTGTGNGLMENLELGSWSPHSRAAYISSEQVYELLTIIDAYRDAGPQAWTLAAPCSAFAAAAWEAATGEKLQHRTLLVSTPSALARSIDHANFSDALASERRPRNTEILPKKSKTIRRRKRPKP